MGGDRHKHINNSISGGGVQLLCLLCAEKQGRR